MTAISLLSKYSREMHACAHQKVCARVFSVELFVIVPIWKVPQCPSTVEQVNKLWRVNTMLYYAAKKISLLVLHATIGVVLKDIILSERSQMFM